MIKSSRYREIKRQILGKSLDSNETNLGIIRIDLPEKYYAIIIDKRSHDNWV